MRGIRFALFAGWVATSLLAVAGFAAFSPADSPQLPPSTTSPTRAPAPGLGRAAGALSALAFTYLAEEALPDPILIAAQLEAAAFTRLATTTTTAPQAPLVRPSLPPPSPTTTIAAAPRPPAAFLSEEAVRALVVLYFRPEDVERAVAVAYCESRFNPSAVNPRTGASGLFQHMPRYWAERSTRAGWAGASIFDAQASTAVAAWLLYSDSAGWSHWDC